MKRSLFLADTGTHLCYATLVGMSTSGMGAALALGRVGREEKGMFCHFRLGCSSIHSGSENVRLNSLWVLLWLQSWNCMWFPIGKPGLKARHSPRVTALFVMPFGKKKIASAASPCGAQDSVAGHAAQVVHEPGLS